MSTREAAFLGPFAGTFPTVDQHQMVEIVGSVAAVHFVLMSNLSYNLPTELLLSTVGLTDQAI